MAKSKSALKEPEPREFKKIEACVYPHRCPVCGIETSYIYCMENAKDGVRSDWYRCQCGVVFQDKFPESTEVYDNKYIAQLEQTKHVKDRYEYLVRLYAPLIEEITFGRMMLEVGFCIPAVYNKMTERGWLTWAIDLNPALTGRGNLYNGDFCTYDFSLKGEAITAATGLEKIDRTFDLIWMGHTLEHFQDPLLALRKAYDLLSETGVLFITTPDIDFINKCGLAGWPYFIPKEHYVLWSEPALCRELERIGFNIIYKRRNFSTRFVEWHDLHIIAQKNYF